MFKTFAKNHTPVWSTTLALVVAFTGCGDYGEDEPTSVFVPDQALLDTMAASNNTAPVQVLQLLRFNDTAAYPQDEFPGDTGRAAYARYEDAFAPILDSVGGEVVRRYDIELAADGETWDAAVFQQFPDRLALANAYADPAHADAWSHLEAALEDLHALVIEPRDVPLPTPVSDFVPSGDWPLEPAEIDEIAAEIAAGMAGNGHDSDVNTARGLMESDEQGPFHMLNIWRMRDIAEYPDDSYPERTGEEANGLYVDVMMPLMLARGSAPIVTNTVEGVLVGEDMGWEAVVLVGYQSREALVDIMRVPAFQDALVHKWAALERNLSQVSILR